MAETTAAPAKSATVHSASGPRVVIGILLELIFVAGSILHIQTSEAFFLSGDTVGLSPNWNILLQPWYLAQGTLVPRMAEAVMWGWGIELIFLICVVGYDIVHEGVARGNKTMAKLFRTGTVVLVFFDGYTDFQYGNVASGFWGQLAFALIMAFIVFYFGTAGWHLIFNHNK